MNIGINHQLVPSGFCQWRQYYFKDDTSFPRCFGPFLPNIEVQGSLSKEAHSNRVSWLRPPQVSIGTWLLGTTFLGLTYFDTSYCGWRRSTSHQVGIPLAQVVRIGFRFSMCPACELASRTCPTHFPAALSPWGTSFHLLKNMGVACGSKLNSWGDAGFGLCFHIPRCHVGTCF